MDRCAICGAVTVTIKAFLFEMSMVILGVLSFSRLSLNVINIVVVVDSR